MVFTLIDRVLDLLGQERVFKKCFYRPYVLHYLFHVKHLVYPLAAFFVNFLDLVFAAPAALWDAEPSKAEVELEGVHCFNLNGLLLLNLHLQLILYFDFITVILLPSIFCVTLSEQILLLRSRPEKLSGCHLDEALLGNGIQKDSQRENDDFRDTT